MPSNSTPASPATSDRPASATPAGTDSATQSTRDTPTTTRATPNPATATSTSDADSEDTGGTRDKVTTAVPPGAEHPTNPGTKTEVAATFSSPRAGAVPPAATTTGVLHRQGAPANSRNQPQEVGSHPQRQSSNNPTTPAKAKTANTGGAGPGVATATSSKRGRPRSAAQLPRSGPARAEGAHA